MTEIGGAVSRSTFLFTVDLAPPSVGLTAAASGASLASAPLIKATAGDANIVSVSADVLSNADPVRLDLQGSIASNGVVTLPSFIDNEPDGPRTIIVTAIDAAGNESTAQRNYTKDTLVPVLSDLQAREPARVLPAARNDCVHRGASCRVFPFSGCIFR